MMNRMLFRLIVIGMVVSCFALAAACGKASAPKGSASAHVSSPTVDFSASVSQDEAADAVFSAAVSDFISGFNAVYRADHGEDYLLPLKDDHWVRLTEPSLCFGYDAPALITFGSAAPALFFPDGEPTLYKSAGLWYIWGESSFAALRAAIAALRKNRNRSGQPAVHSDPHRRGYPNDPGRGTGVIIS